MENDIVAINAHRDLILNQKLDEWEVWIDRKHSPLGNPYSHLEKQTLAGFHVATRDEAINSYAKWIVEQLSDDSVNVSVKREYLKLKEIYQRFGKLTMICWCVPHRCHGEILKELILKDIQILTI